MATPVPVYAFSFLPRKESFEGRDRDLTEAYYNIGSNFPNRISQTEILPLAEEAIVITATSLSR
jgi:hypothetical protein